MADQLTLAFDTSAAHCAAALLLGDTILVSRVEEMQKGQAERLMPLLEEVLTEAGKGWPDLHRIGVGIGPGNFTGIRISVSAARGLALSLGIPAIGVSILEAQAFGLSGLVLSCLNARQGRVYTQMFHDGSCQPPAMMPLSASDIPMPDAKTDCGVTGSYADTVAQALQRPVRPNPTPVIEAIARIASARTPSGARPAPLYLRPADAAPPRDPAPTIL